MKLYNAKNLLGGEKYPYAKKLFLHWLDSGKKSNFDPYDMANSGMPEKIPFKDMLRDSISSRVPVKSEIMEAINFVNGNISKQTTQSKIYSFNASHGAANGETDWHYAVNGFNAYSDGVVSFDGKNYVMSMKVNMIDRYNFNDYPQGNLDKMKLNYLVAIGKAKNFWTTGDIDIKVKWCKGQNYDHATIDGLDGIDLNAIDTGKNGGWIGK
jgi:hypothetical protein